MELSDDVRNDPNHFVHGGHLYFLKGWLSQWHPSVFSVDGRKYNCCEQWMMAEKARLFGDTEALSQIMQTPHPKRQKALGRGVRGFDERRWEKVREEVVFRGNLEKFHQNGHLAKLLLGTGHLKLAEANAQDHVWGIGVSMDMIRAKPGLTWCGENLLGKTLVRVRGEL